MKWLTKVFVLGDILSFVVQGSSIDLSLTKYPTGAKAVILIGFFIQLISFGLVWVTAVIYYSRIWGFRRPSATVLICRGRGLLKCSLMSVH